MAMDSSVENNMYINKVWVQCENESCLKWRLLSNEDKAKVNHSEPWYCFMNTDSKYNKCSVSEEDFPEESQLHQSGYKIVYSQLPLGSLVLVKLKNWPSWPGILCPDPFKGKYVTYDLDGDVEQYHVEFLGDPHSRTWIDAEFVRHYSITLKGCFLLGSKAELTCLFDLSSLNLGMGQARACRQRKSFQTWKMTRVRHCPGEWSTSQKKNASQKNVRKISGIRVPYKKHTSCMDVLMSKGWKDATYQNRTNPKQLAKLLWWPRKGCKFPKITLKRKIPNLEKGKGKLF
ncbi:zinc finger CW-type PWWP domain protein 2 isoform X2 [Bos indicus]|uniref:Zinc finger CW-type PWWP domain protein 2 isoform X2 n=1 Tax=Bos indicus TaxID=9915 RepID=A0ABM4RCX1_BOSIN